MFRLIVDDERTFKDAPEQRDFEKGHINIYARNSASAIAILRGCNVDELWLDHDLGEDDTAMKVVDFLCEHHQDFREGIWVHSMNPVGAENIIRALSPHYLSVRRVPLPECV